MSYLTQLAAVARRTGYPVTEVPGWRTRGHGEQPSVQGVVCHHTGGAATGDYPSLGVVRDGRSDLAGPLSHFGLGRSGRIYVIAAGRCWHNAPSTSAHHTNSASIGIEAENTGTGQAWPAAQLDAYRLLVAEICREFGLPASRVKAHREVNTQKDDPHGINMNAFRGDVDRLIKGEDNVTPDDIKKIADAVADRVWKKDLIPAPAGSAASTNPTWQPQSVIKDTNERTRAILGALAKSNDPNVDTAVIVRGVLEGLDPAAIAAAVADALPPELAGQVVNELRTRLET